MLLFVLSFRAMKGCQSEYGELPTSTTLLTSCSITEDTVFPVLYFVQVLHYFSVICLLFLQSVAYEDWRAGSFAGRPL